MDALRLDGVCKSFGASRAVAGLSACVPVGSIYGFLGPNGAGKTTTLRMVMDIIYPDSGRIAVLGDTSTSRAKDRIGYMPEERGLYPKMTVRKILGFLGAIKGVPHQVLRQRIGEWLGRVGLEDCADKKVEELSRGMQQKLQFVATVLHDPELLILDEPFSGLDPVNLDLLAGLVMQMRDAGKTVIFSTHMMEQAERLCDAILLINKGTKVIDGPIEAIREHYATGVVAIEAEGETAFIDVLPMVASVTRNDRALEIELRDGADAQALLEALVGRVRLTRFEVKIPSLHEVFVRLVGEHDE